MKILVTGGAGFIGSNFIHYWLKNHPQDKVTNFDKLTYAGNLESLKDLEKNSNYNFIKGDISDPVSVKEAMAGIDIVVNFAAESHVDRSILDPAPFITTNVVGTQILLDAALKNKVRKFHHVSTDEVFGALTLDSKDRFNEETKYSPNSPYAASKAASDHLVRAYFHTFSLPITITNCSNNFGPYQFPEKLISLAITNLLEGKKIPVYGDGLYVRDWLYVEDHCRAIDLVLEKGKIGETYCIGVDNDIPNILIIKKILKTLGFGEEKIEYVKDRPGHDRRYAIDATKIKKDLGWQPKYDFDQALEETVKWYQGNKDWWQKLKDKKFEDYYKRQYVTR
ncbi:dTDP-glucose 4,6-dehydratase [Candidatus Curtissbacteria bacterium RIFOXYD1_FULL_41_36]|uniref:dTDP-glucose 4,6-dehydratase n=1 Tax=Candidatus Curtissbacteria bacterium RIFOXYA1_FULL_41_14 TaxID=1797737 RepID=A0A1F5HAW3_9BACT|nr:MAG: dTDP-glucose 4,6-dehydratase [Candidatus Curtissbacteria bacterium GW2011_GWD1_40_8]OGD79218.1 MAG: dTDP-glucose 4,6-dehydratase [Candidatus Curtissbacteria bacterium RIFCSPHIGHO2_01_FULL_34_40]OGD91347.1 MAG: dTDP-glucose 4,6-dehydratase [Candidatus Curtissbacteria bacterium RIFCSPHIGHO2_12_FULL_41_13]OGE01293.1 MAG: dTDP-glucose 4,6-dehydratase [Candidatus Curtissbacteria bacterium RIFOXYA1_FULL_41_14]OGE06883.1 MAG: dTDP-glucose 4,6-dehydratase [Candidatus Curtissbacteria bacterium R